MIKAAEGTSTTTKALLYLTFFLVWGRNVVLFCLGSGFWTKNVKKLIGIQVKTSRSKLCENGKGNISHKPQLLIS